MMVATASRVFVALDSQRDARGIAGMTKIERQAERKKRLGE